MSNFNLSLFQYSWLLPLLFGILGLFLSIWIVVPAPTFSLLPLGVCAPELSPWLLTINAIALILAIVFYRGGVSNVAIICSLIGLLLSSLPLGQFSHVNNSFNTEMERVLGKDYLDNIARDAKSKMRSQPLEIADVFRGIAIPDIRTNKGIVFACPDGIDLKLNIYQPLALGEYPTLIIIYGGAWRMGSPDDYEQFSSYMAAQGYSAITIDYRHAPQYKFPTQLEDVEAALKYLKTNATDLNIDLSKTAIMGRSAGGHLGTIAAYRQKVIPIQAVVNYYGPVDLADGYYDLPTPDPIKIQTVLDDFLGGSPEEQPELYQQASVSTFIGPELPPSLLIYPSRDHLVQAKFGRGLYDKLKTSNNSAILLEIPWAEHAFDAVFFGVSNQLALYYTERFLTSVLK